MTAKAFRHCLFLFALITACLSSTAVETYCAESTPHNKILILNSYHYGYKGSDDIVKGFSDRLLKSLPGTEIQIEYLDSKNYNGKDFDAKILDLLKFKYQQRHFDLIFSTDDYAFNILEQQRERIFGTTPVVFCGTNSFDRSRLAGKHGIAGIDERPSFKATLDLIFRLHPATKNIVVIRDDSVTGKLNDAEFRKVATDFQNRARYSYLAGLRLDALLDRVKRLPSDSVVVYFASFVENRSGERIPSNEALRMVSAASPVPMYGGWEFNLGKGIVGGRLIDLREHGVSAAAMAARVLRGESIDSMPPISPSPNKDMFDYNQLRRFGITESRLPEGSVIVNKPPGFLWSHRVEILATISVILLLGLAISFIKLVHSRSNLKIHRDALIGRNDELEQALSKVKVLEGIIPVCMYCKKVRKDEESWQQMESYISQHTEAQFSHGICPACFHEKFGKRPRD